MSSLPPSFPADLKQFVDDQVAQGKYDSASAVVNDAVRLLRDREERLRTLRRDIDNGIAQLDAGEFIELTSQGEIRAYFDDIERRGQQPSATRPVSP
jgi:antitoxin ParD1/3/4